MVVHLFSQSLQTQLSIKLLVLLAVLVSCGFSISAQSGTSATDGSTPTGMQPGAPTGSYQLSGFDNVNLFNGHLNFGLPLIHIGGRGSAGYTINLNLERQWRSVKSPSAPWGFWPETGAWGNLHVGYSPGVLIGRVVGAPTHGLCSDNEGPRDTLTRLTFIGPDGTEYELRDVAHNGDDQTSIYNFDCSVGLTANRGKVFVSKDGSGVTFISDADILDAYGFNIEEIHPSGDLFMKDGTRYHIQDGSVTAIVDRNGNKVVGLTDSLNRPVTITHAADHDTITFKGADGLERTIKVWFSAMSLNLRSDSTIKTFQQLFPEMTTASNAPFDPTIASSVELPDGRRYFFKYNEYGELARVELPTGGAFEYDYAAGLVTGPESGSYGGGSGALTNKQIYRRMVTKRIFKDSSSSVYESKLTISRPQQSLTQADDFVQVEQYDSANKLLSREKHYYFGSPIIPQGLSPIDYSHWKDGREWKTETLTLGSPATVVRSVEHTWEQPINGATWPLTQAETNAGARPNDPQITQTQASQNRLCGSSRCKEP